MLKTGDKICFITYISGLKPLKPQKPEPHGIQFLFRQGVK